MGTHYRSDFVNSCGLGFAETFRLENMIVTLLLTELISYHLATLLMITSFILDSVRNQICRLTKLVSSFKSVECAQCKFSVREQCGKRASSLQITTIAFNKLSHHA